MPPVFHTHQRSWLNWVECVFADLTQKQLYCGAFTGVASPEKVALEYLEASNENAKPFAWIGDAKPILGRVAGNHATISKSGH